MKRLHPHFQLPSLPAAPASRSIFQFPIFNFQFLTALTLALCALCALLAAAPAQAAPTFRIDDSGIVIDRGDASPKLTLSLPVFVNSAKAKSKIAEKSITGKSATLKFEGGGQLDLEITSLGELILKPTNIPADTKFIYSSMKFGNEAYLGGKWSFAGKQDTFPAEKTAAAFLHQGNANGLSLTTAAGATTTLHLPGNTYEQLQDGRQWGANTIFWQCWMLVLPGTDRITIKVDETAPSATAATAPSAPKSTASTATASAPASAPQKPTEAKIDPSSGTQILKWKDGKKACFMLAFDDSAPSQLKNVVPELDRRKIVGNFFLVTGNAVYANTRTKWEEAAKSPYFAAQNHTFTHKGVLTPEELDEELKKCNEVLYKLYPDRKLPRLIGFGQPGGVPWVVSKEEFQAGLTKHNLANRPPFYGPPMHYKSAAECIGAVDTAIAKGEMGHLDYHGVGGDWLTTPVEWFTALLDKLEASRDQLWIADTVSWHQYVKERQNAEIKVLESTKTLIRLDLTTALDPQLYDLPLTLSTKVPADWKSCQFTQGTEKQTLPIKDGAVQYNALPGGGVITLRPTP